MTVTSLESRRAKHRESAKRSYDARVRVNTELGIRSECVVCGEEFYAKRRETRVCGPGYCQKVLNRQRLEPNTIQHFKKWARTVTLDNGKPWIVEGFQEAFIIDLFAGVPELWLLIAEGNTKTTMLGGLGLYHIQHTPNGRVPIAASAKDQAGEMYLQMESMVMATPWMQHVFVCQEGYRRIRCNSMNSRVQIFSADDRTGDGVIFTLGLVDELHRHKDLRLYRTWTGKLDKRDGAQVAAISTAGEPGSDFEETRARIRQTGKIRHIKPGYIRAETETMVLHDYSIPEGASPDDMKAVKCANPFSGVTIESLRRKRARPTMTLQHWLRMTCNRSTRGANAAVSELEWYEAEIDEEIPLRSIVGVGMDVAWVNDTFAMVPLWMPSIEKRVLGEASILEPPRNGTMLSVDDVKSAFIDIAEQFQVETVVMDIERARDLAQWIADEFDITVVDRGQGNAMKVLDYNTWMEGLRGKFLKHVHSPGLNEHVLNAVTRILPGGDTRFARPVASRRNVEQQKVRVIDALDAAAMIHTTMVADFLEPAPVKKPMPMLAAI